MDLVGLRMNTPAETSRSVEIVCSEPAMLTDGNGSAVPPYSSGAGRKL
jgi:hypothetical protein